MELAKIEIQNFGLAATHNMPCAVCGAKKAVLNLDSGTFSPCWECQKDGWRLSMREMTLWCFLKSLVGKDK